MERDVIVVGAGPAGAAAAICLAKKGRDVLLLDRQAFPRDKACGDGIPPGSMAVLSELGLKDQIIEAGFYPIHKLLLVTPGGYSLNPKFTPKKPGMDFFIAPRVQFDYLLQQQAVKCGAEFCRAQVSAPILDGSRVVGVRASINGESREILGRVVLGADGATSAIARALSPKIKQEDTARIVAVRAYIEDLEILPHTVEFYWYKDILPGYAWIFPLNGNRANIGIGMRVDRFREKKQSLESLLADFLNRPPVKARLANGGRLQNIKSWPLNLASAKNIQRVYHGALLIGDAASLIDPFSGEGIHNALISASIAAGVVHRALEKGDVSPAALNAYERECRKTFGGIVRRSHILQLCMTHAPFLMDGFIRLVQANPRLTELLVNKFSIDFQFDTEP